MKYHLLPLERNKDLSNHLLFFTMLSLYIPADVAVAPEI